VEVHDLCTSFKYLENISDAISDVTNLVVDCLKSGGKVMFCGNGGSAADSQHLATELMGRYKRDRAPMAALALTVDTSALTAIANDYAFEDVFARQLRGIGRTGDVLIGLSTSGNSENVLKAVRLAREMQVHTVAFTGSPGGALAELADLCIVAPASVTNRIQEMHIAIGHMICGFVEEALC
jgi:D-sedoheptulose 7-phosphate isomerase